MLMIERMLNEALGLRARPAPRKTPTAKHIAIFPCGTEVEIERRGGRKREHAYFSLTAPNGDRWESSLRDVKLFAEREHPGVRFTRR